MSKGEITPIGEAVDKFLNQGQITPDGYAVRLFFSDFIGPKLSKYAELVKLSDDTVFISVKKASVVKNEIMLMRIKTIRALNEFLGKGTIKHLRIISE